MTDPMLQAITAGAALIGTIVVALTALRAWRDWLALQRLSLDGHRASERPATSGARIELADLKERVRKLEAIAAGVDL